jgi:hypothetical protein
MMAERLVGLVSVGPCKGSGLERVPRLADSLGPVKAVTLRVASRIANQLRAGYPVYEYSDLEVCPLIVLNVSEKAISSIAQELTEGIADWRGRAAVLWNTPVPSTRLEVIARRGGETGSCTELSVPLGGRRYLVEGTPPARKALLDWIHERKSTVWIVQPEQKPLYLAGVSLSEAMCLPLAHAVAACFRHCGLKPGPAAEMAANLMQNTLRAYTRAGTKAWSDPAPTPPPAQLLEQIAALERSDARLADYFRAQLRLSAAWMGKNAETA